MLLNKMETQLAAHIQKAFAEGLCAIQLKSELCDMAISCHGRNFPCHQLIVCTKSPVMKEMLRRSGTSTIVVLEFGPPIVEMLLTFMYTGLVDVSKLSVDSIGTLLSAASHYQVKFCEEAAEFGLAKTLSVHNAVDNLVFAVENMLKGLRIAAVKFIVEHGREIMSKPQEKAKLKLYPEVMVELFEAMT